MGHLHWSCKQQKISNCTLIQELVIVCNFTYTCGFFLGGGVRLTGGYFYCVGNCFVWYFIYLIRVTVFVSPFSFQYYFYFMYIIVIFICFTLCVYNSAKPSGGGGGPMMPGGGGGAAGGLFAGGMPKLRPAGSRLGGQSSPGIVI